jgi:hypothetical protein
MSDRGVSDYDMANRTRRHPADEPGFGPDFVPGIPDATLSALLQGGTPEADVPPALQYVADVLAALRAEPAADEAAGRAVALAEFRLLTGASQRLSGSRRVRPAVLIPMLRSRAGTAATAAVVGLGGLAVAAYAGALPAAAQQVAHDAIGAPRPMPASHDRPAAGQHGAPAGPDATARAHYGLCTAYAHGHEHDFAAAKSVAFRKLAKAAGGAASVPSYCGGAPHPGVSHAHSGKPAGRAEARKRPHTTGKPPHP